MHMFRSILLALLPAILLAPSLPAAAAESYDNCTGFVDSLPATITTQGTWCLRKDLATSITSGSAITIATNNVTLDCNDFKIGGLGAGDSSNAYGIFTYNQLNATARRCNVRGFRYGTFMSGSGHILEDNRFEQNLHVGIFVTGDNHMIRRNAVLDTGRPLASEVLGIQAEADIIDNTVAGMMADPAYSTIRGIVAYGVGAEIKGNRVRVLPLSSGGNTIGIWSLEGGQRISGNHLSARTNTSVSGWGIRGKGLDQTFCDDNTVSRFSIGIAQCQDVGGNASR